MRALWIILYLILCVAVGAAGDAWNHIGMKTIGHAGEALEVGLLISGAFVFNLRRRDWLPFVAVYICFRIVGFDYVHNLVTGQPIFHMDTVSIWGSFLSKFPAHGVTFMRAVALFVGIGISINELK